MKTSHFIFSLLLFLSVAGLAVASTPPPETTAPAYDIRILIDVSGSMKQNDPANLRKPALRLLTGLLPSGTQAGVWTFARYVNMMVRYGEVNTAWREQAMGSADQIGSAGLFTDMESALDKASWNWTDAAPGVRRSIILLTDGLVDVSDAAESDRKSRARITDAILPRLQAAGVEVYSIALSNDADEHLLRQISASTGGWFERADDADQLERIFLRMFEKAANPDTLPLIDNQVLVDDSIEELTLLVFRAENAPATTLTAPDGASFGATRLLPNARWHSDAHYDLVTIEKPATGTWHVNAEIDPDNRVMVVSNLRVVATQLPNQILAGDTQDLLIRFTEQNLPVTRKEFLNFITVKVQETSADDIASERLLLDNGRDGDIMAGDGIFSTQLSGTDEPGAHSVVVDVDGTTFKRQHRQDVEIVESPVIADIRTDENGAALFMIPRAGIIDPETLQASATITGEDEQAEVHRMLRTGPGEWRLGLEVYPPDGRYQVVLDIEAERTNGKPIHYQGRPLYFGHAVSPPSEPSDTEAAEEPSDNGEAIVEEDAVENGAETDNGSAPVNWMLVITLVILLNALLGGALFLIYRKLFGNNAESAAAKAGDAPEKPASEDKNPAESVTAADTAPTPFDNSKPSIVTQIAEAATAAESITPDPDVAIADQEQAAEETETDAMEPEPAQTLEEAAPSAGPRQYQDSSPELIMEEDNRSADAEEVDDHLKNLNVEEIDLIFEEKTRSTG